MSDDKKEEASASSKVDDELSELLDSALEDFKKEPTKETKNESPETENLAELGEEWSDDFLRQFESNLTNFLGSNPDGSLLTPEQVQQKFQDMTRAAQEVSQNPVVNDTSSDFASTITQTLLSLSEGTENLQQPISDQDIMNMFGGREGDQNNFIPLMQGMMQSLLSKDVLYPSIKDILGKFPQWLESNKGSLSEQDFTRYSNQEKLMEEVCAELEKETSSDSVEVKQERFDKVLNLMQKLQDYGQPPAELVGDLGDGSQLPNFDPNQCNLM